VDGELSVRQAERLRRVDCRHYTECLTEMVDEAGWVCPCPAFCFEHGAQRETDRGFATLRQERKIHGE
jgi:hypothetical protein